MCLTQDTDIGVSKNISPSFLPFQYLLAVLAIHVVPISKEEQMEVQR